MPFPLYRALLRTVYPTRSLVGWLWAACTSQTQEVLVLTVQHSLPCLGLDSLSQRQGNTHGASSSVLYAHFLHLCHLWGPFSSPSKSPISIIISTQNCFLVYSTSPLSLGTFSTLSNFCVFHFLFPGQKIRLTQLMYSEECWLLVSQCLQDKASLER